MQALQAARAKANEALRASHGLLIPKPWTPKEAQQAMKALWERPLAESDRAALERLAKDERMRAVWKKLPSEVDRASFVRWAMLALQLFPSLRDPRPRSKERAAQTRKRAVQGWIEYWLRVNDQWYERQSPGELVWETCARVAFRLHEALEMTGDEEWSRHWPRDASSPRTSMGDRTSAAGFFLDAARCFLSIKAADQSFKAKLPPIKVWNEQAPQLFFSRYMADKLDGLPQPLINDLVSTLTAVAFGLRVAPGPERIRGRRRTERKTRAENRPPISTGTRQSGRK